MQPDARQPQSFRDRRLLRKVAKRLGLHPLSSAERVVEAIREAVATARARQAVQTPTGDARPASDDASLRELQALLAQVSGLAPVVDGLAQASEGPIPLTAPLEALRAQAKARRGAKQESPIDRMRP